jgi:hypothetical protein
MERFAHKTGPPNVFKFTVPQFSPGLIHRLNILYDLVKDEGNVAFKSGLHESNGSMDSVA